MEITDTNYFTQEISVYFTDPIFRKLKLVRQSFVKNIDVTFYKNPTRGVVADTKSRTEGRGLHLMR
jgi:hypothetical protein